jgi:hypothetical protein
MRPKFSDHSGPCEHRTVVKPTKATQIYGIFASSRTRVNISDGAINANEKIGCYVSNYLGRISIGLDEYFSPNKVIKQISHLEYH